jgi:hypothetical protein
VLDHVGDGLLDHPVGGQVQPGRKPAPLAADVDVDLDAGRGCPGSQGAGLLSLIVTWWAGPIDRAGGFRTSLGQLSRFSPVVFGARDIAPAGYAAFGFVLGVTVGALIRRTLPAMAVTLAVFVTVQLIMPNVVRPHLLPPVTATTAVNVSLSTAIVDHNGQVTVPVTGLSGAWIFSNQTITPAGM